MKTYLFGSKLLKLNNCHDEDWLTFVDEPGHVALSTPGARSTPFYKRALERFIQEKGNWRASSLSVLWQYQLSSGFFENETEYPFNDFNILNYKRQWINMLQTWMNSDITENKIKDILVLPKEFYHILYQYYMIVENTHWITEVSKEEVQKIHDLQVPATYFYELRDLINSLKCEEN